MGYTENEISDIRKEDFTMHFMCTLGAKPHVIDVLPAVHRNIYFDDAEKEKVVHLIEPGIELNLVPYTFLKDIKLRSPVPKIYGMLQGLKNYKMQKKIPDRKANKSPTCQTTF